MYLSWQDNEDPKFTAIEHLIEPSQPATQEEPVVVDDLPEPRAPDSQLRENELIEPNTLESDGHWDPNSHQQVGIDDGTDGDMVREDPLSPGYDFDDPTGNMDDTPVGEPDTSMADMLASLGADEKTASRYIKNLAKKTGSYESTFIEVYVRRDVNVKGLDALDIRTTKSDGTPWDFSKKADRKKARDLVDRLDPTWMIGSPPCTAFSMWNYAMNHPKMDPQVVAAQLTEGRRHLAFVCTLYKRQIQRGKYFLHEHPALARS